MLRSSPPSFSAAFRARRPHAHARLVVIPVSFNFPQLTQLPSADPVSGLARPPARPQPSLLAGNPLLRAQVTPASTSSDPRFPQLLSLELLPSFHFRAVPGPGASPLPVSGPPSHFRGTLAVFTLPTCTSGPPLSLFLDALQAPEPTSGPPTPSGLPNTRTPHPGSENGPPHGGGQKEAPTGRPPQLPHGPGPSGRRLPRAPSQSTPGPVLPQSRRRRREKAERGPSRGADTTGLPGTFCSSSSPQPRLAPPLATAPQLPSLAPKSSVRTRWRGNNFHSLPPPPDGGSGGGGGGSSGPFNYQLSRSTAAGVRLRPRRLPPRYSNTLWELLFPPAAQTGSSAGQAPLPTRGPSHRPSLSQRPNRLPQRPAISSRSLRGTRKGNMKLHLISLRRGHPPPLRGSRN
ncbi:basic salivary proline-rich protein 4-like [Phyllostomus hastatus]|uniref:basic salivary proline-rich protein 4-like n=1 Tax=Phyllostomus hastatus TaxID=9423 RepID=UPI001E682AA4|nr:basic salivary proline-rich protein 4-like [Phyllostomus hastatus]